MNSLAESEGVRRTTFWLLMAAIGVDVGIVVTEFVRVGASAPPGGLVEVVVLGLGAGFLPTSYSLPVLVTAVLHATRRRARMWQSRTVIALLGLVWLGASVFVLTRYAVGVGTSAEARQWVTFTIGRMAGQASLIIVAIVLTFRDDLGKLLWRRSSGPAPR
ncbi:hypothetical protein [Pseudonocardia sp. TRM90224]|uniref:hypothetical protein n=1 Tax=Pseudonocardia sp. TRM90224 TaxID=2812678 RepID=UPI001E4A2E15|nr:hypothetical protein [Pseudonocardia sp. TRM90224]